MKIKKKNLIVEIENLHKLLNKQYDKVKRQANEISLLLAQKEELKESLFTGTEVIVQQAKFIKIQEKQLLQQDKAIEYKDKQFLGLRSAYQDEIINKMQ